MADGKFDTRNIYTPSGKLITSTIKGSEAGKDDKYSKLSEQDAWDGFKKDKKLSFTASKAKYAQEFADWRKTKAKQTGQQKALAEEK